MKTKVKYDMDKAISAQREHLQNVALSLDLLETFKVLGVNKFKNLFSEEVIKCFWYWDKKNINSTILSYEDFILEFCDDIAGSLYCGSGFSWKSEAGTYGSSSGILYFNEKNQKFYLKHDYDDNELKKLKNKTNRESLLEKVKDWLAVKRVCHRRKI